MARPRTFLESRSWWGPDCGKSKSEKPLLAYARRSVLGKIIRWSRLYFFFRLLLLFYSYFGFLHTKCFCQQLWSRNVPKLGKLLYIHKVGYHVLCTTAVSNLAHFLVGRTWESLGSRRSSTRYIFLNWESTESVLKTRQIGAWGLRTDFVWTLNTL